MNDIISFTCPQCGGPLDYENPRCPYCKTTWSRRNREPVTPTPFGSYSPSSQYSVMTSSVVITTGATWLGIAKPIWESNGVVSHNSGYDPFDDAPWDDARIDAYNVGVAHG